MSHGIGVYVPVALAASATAQHLALLPSLCAPCVMACVTMCVRHFTRTLTTTSRVTTGATIATRGIAIVAWCCKEDCTPCHRAQRSNLSLGTEKLVVKYRQVATSWWWW